MTSDREKSVALPESVDAELTSHLIRPDGQEDITFALWSPSEGRSRDTALVHTVVLPRSGERAVHGNASVFPAYYERALELAKKEKSGLVLLHSHLGPGWQDMSPDDIAAEKKFAPATLTMTGLPLLGTTVGTDGMWSGRWWPYAGQRTYRRVWCKSVRVVGKRLRTDFCRDLAPVPPFRELFKRTATVWGPKNHSDLARLRVGIVGLGSVGSIVAETLARMGLTSFVLIDFDELQPHNLDRVLGAGMRDLGKLKVHVAEQAIRFAATAESVEVQAVPHSIAEVEGYKAALDCDVLFSCVDRPRARSILNHLAYAHLIPVVDGGIQVRLPNGIFSGVDWQLQTVAPERPCLACLGTFSASDVSCEADGHLDDPSYLDGLPADHRFKRNENVFPFSANLASLEVLQMVALVTGLAKQPEIGVQRYRYVPGILDVSTARRCDESCEMKKLTGLGDRYFTLTGRDHAAEAARLRQGG